MNDTVTVVEKKSDGDLFIEKASAAAAVVSNISSFEEAVDYTIELCLKNDLRRYTIDDSGVSLDGLSKTIAAPSLSETEFNLLGDKCALQEIDCINSGMRNYLAGIDIGFSYADIGIAETGTLVLNCPDEELRLATMMCEAHVCVLPKSCITVDAYAAEPQLTEFMLGAPAYTAFITGPSRTADIERVLSIGVHGPLELHILILED